MARILLAALALAMFAAVPANAAELWGIEHESKARFEAKVVDILCELTGNCPADCGAGKRQLGLLRDDGVLVLVSKNFDPFAGGANDLAAFCGKRVIADGLMIDDPLMPMFALQFKRLAPDGEWSRGTQFSKDWQAAHPELNVKQWFRDDPRIKAEIQRGGVYGIPGLAP